ncbi:hypothetical protein [Tessaracoccus coleopterorum]|uniref:hypothetical protein n=1 Tax=Tessaracoccus coleopterorum TaxID=2714950 RepID=UPI0018D34C93|nr:hypothetical protein [Tessaracoccus coleopterorum]
MLVGTLTLARRALMRLGRPIPANYTHFVLDLPFRSLARMSGGLVDMAMLDSILTAINGHPVKGLRRLIRTCRDHRRSNRTEAN